MKISAVEEGAEWKSALSSTAPNELIYALPKLLMGQIQNTSRYFFIQTKKRDCLGQKTFLRYCPFNAVAFISTGNSVPAITDFHSWCLLHTVLNY